MLSTRRDMLFVPGPHLFKIARSPTFTFLYCLHRHAPDLGVPGSREMVTSSVWKSSLFLGETTQPRLILELAGLEHSPSVMMRRPSHRPRFLGSLAIFVGALKSVPPPRTRFAVTSVPFRHSNASLMSAVQSKGRTVTATFFVRDDSSLKKSASWASSTEPDWSIATRSFATYPRLTPGWM